MSLPSFSRLAAGTGSARRASTSALLDRAPSACRRSRSSPGRDRPTVLLDDAPRGVFAPSRCTPQTASYTALSSAKRNQSHNLPLGLSHHLQHCQNSAHPSARYADRLLIVVEN